MCSSMTPVSTPSLAVITFMPLRSSRRLVMAHSDRVDHQHQQRTQRRMNSSAPTASCCARSRLARLMGADVSQQIKDQHHAPVKPRMVAPEGHEPPVTGPALDHDFREPARASTCSATRWSWQCTSSTGNGMAFTGQPGLAYGCAHHPGNAIHRFCPP